MDSKSFWASSFIARPKTLLLRPVGHLWVFWTWRKYRRTRLANTPAKSRFIYSAIHNPAVTAACICFFRSVQHSKTYNQNQHCKEERKSSELSEKLHPKSPPFSALGFNFAFQFCSLSVCGAICLLFTKSFASQARRLFAKGIQA